MLRSSRSSYTRSGLCITQYFLGLTPLKEEEYYIEFVLSPSHGDRPCPKAEKLLQAWRWAHRYFRRGSALDLTTAAWLSRADPLHVVYRPPPTICARRYTVILSITRSRRTVRFQRRAEGPRWVATAAIKGWTDCRCMCVYLPIRDSPQGVVTDHPFHRCIWNACRNKNGPIYSTDLGLQAIFICLVTGNLDLPCTSHQAWNRPG